MKLAVIIPRYLGKPYLGGGLGPKSYDCLGLIISLAEATGHPMPYKWGSWDRFDYYDRWEAVHISNPLEAFRIIIDFFSACARPIEVGRQLAGDLLIVGQEKGGFFPAFCVGQGMAIAAFTEKGVMVFRLDSVNFVRAAWRLK